MLMLRGSFLRELHPALIDGWVAMEEGLKNSGWVVVDDGWSSIRKTVRRLDSRPGRSGLIVRMIGMIGMIMMLVMLSKFGSNITQ